MDRINGSIKYKEVYFILKDNLVKPISKRTKQRENPSIKIEWCTT